MLGMSRPSKSVKTFVAVAVGLALLGLVLYLFLGTNQDDSEPSQPAPPDNGLVVTRNIISSYTRDLNHDLTVSLSGNFAPGQTGQLDVSFKQLACRSLVEYLGSDSPESAREQLSAHALSFQAARQSLLDGADLPATSPLVRGDKLSQGILNQGQDIYGNFRLLANYDHYRQQQSDLSIFDDSDLEFIRRGQIIAHALYYADSPSGQPRPDIAYGLTTEGPSPQPVLNYAATVETISQNLDRYQICDLTYIYTNSSDEGLNSPDFGDVCRSGSLPRPAEFSFVVPSLSATAYVNPTVNHPDSWPIAQGALTEDCDGSYIGRNQTHQRVVQFLILADTDLEALTVDVSGQSVLLD